MESFDSIIREYIDFVNQQVGVYMDALAGFAGHRSRVEQQVHRVNRPVRSSTDAQGLPVMVWASYEDPSKPDVIHNRIIRAEDYMAANANGGSNEQQHAKAIVIFLYTYWEDEIRPRLAISQNVERANIRSDVMKKKVGHSEFQRYLHKVPAAIRLHGSYGWFCAEKW